MRTLGVVTVARSDYGIYLPILRRIQAEPNAQLRLWVSGMHLSPEFGRTVSSIEADGYPIADRIEMLVSSDTPEAIAKSMGLGVIGFAQSFARERPDILIVLGDRFEMHAAALAALPFRIPLAHVHGGEVTQGAIDDSLRHSITKLSHLHFVATEEYARRVRQLGEEPWRVTHCGAPALDHLPSVRSMSRAELEKALAFPLEANFLLVTFHPATMQYEKVPAQCAELLTALDAAGHQAVFTLPNADTAGRAIRKQIVAFLETHPRSRLVDNLGTELYFNLMRHAAAMVGNSSSGLIEAPSLGLPVVNIGLRQAGRVRGLNVIDVTDGHDAILAGIKRASTSEFRAALRDGSNPYASGRPAAEVIVSRLVSVALDEHLYLKKFFDVPVSGGSSSSA